VLPITIESKSRCNTCVCTSIPLSNTDTYIVPNTPENTFRPRAQLSYPKYFVFFLNLSRQVPRYYIVLHLGQNHSLLHIFSNGKSLSLNMWW